VTDLVAVAHRATRFRGAATSGVPAATGPTPAPVQATHPNTNEASTNRTSSHRHTRVTTRTCERSRLVSSA
jgi:hypothetical protein